jgi:16S rRNA (adenine1518-N6/adenine1519-N6)-dimethyltransferase
VRRIVAAAELTPITTVVEVGPGPGALTKDLAESSGRLIAVELDRRFATKLRDQFEVFKRVRIVEGDVLTLSPSWILNIGDADERAAYVVVGNLPYNAGAAILRHFLESDAPPTHMVVMLQREVAASITAEPGDMGLLAIGVQVFAEARQLFNVPPSAFSPPPKVVSTVLRLDVRDEPLVPQADQDAFFRIVRAGFSTPRKQLRNSLANGLTVDANELAPKLEAVGLDATRRPEDLSIDEWLKLSRALAPSS